VTLALVVDALVRVVMLRLVDEREEIVEEALELLVAGVEKTVEEVRLSTEDVVWERLVEEDAVTLFVDET
jgi:hypothetical protein